MPRKFFAQFVSVLSLTLRNLATHFKFITTQDGNCMHLKRRHNRNSYLQMIHLRNSIHERIKILVIRKTNDEFSTF
jgi:hypothetical protein